MKLTRRVFVGWVGAGAAATSVAACQSATPVASVGGSPSQCTPVYAGVVKILADDLPTLPLIDRQDHSVASTRFELQSSFWKEGLIYAQLSGVYQK